MTTLDLSTITPIPGFDCVAFKRQVQAEIFQETEGMTDEEVREYFRLADERATLRRKALSRRQALEPQTHD